MGYFYVLVGEGITAYEHTSLSFNVEALSVLEGGQVIKVDGA